LADKVEGLENPLSSSAEPEVRSGRSLKKKSVRNSIKIEGSANEEDYNRSVSPAQCDKSILS
jgi:hypothetical protein